VTDTGDLAKALVDAATVVIGAPTLIFGPHPQVVYAAYLANLLRPKTRYATVIGSYGWGGKTVDTLKDMLGRLKVEFLEPVYVKGYPKEEDFAALDRLADDIRKRHEEAGPSWPEGLPAPSSGGEEDTPCGFSLSGPLGRATLPNQNLNSPGYRSIQ